MASAAAHSLASKPRFADVSFDFAFFAISRPWLAEMSEFHSEPPT
jgi:hypothetical protein